MISPARERGYGGSAPDNFLCGAGEDTIYVESDDEAQGRGPNRIEDCEHVVVGDPSAANARFDGLYGASHPGLAAGGPGATAALDAIAQQADNSRIVGYGADDRLTGGPVGDNLVGNGGDDVLSGLGGADDIDGGPGADLISGGPGNDRLFGRTGDDRILGDDGDDEITGDRGNDDLLGGAGDGHGQRQGGGCRHRRLRPRLRPRGEGPLRPRGGCEVVG